MLEMKLTRIARRANYTIGRLYINGKYQCDTLEPTEREGGTKIKGRTAIPKGTYKVFITYSYKFKKDLPLLSSVPDFTGVRIHSGNSAADTEGCILCGLNKEVGRVLDSRVETSKVIRRIEEELARGGRAEITVE